jgi:hypothetical protein
MSDDKIKEVFGTVDEVIDDHYMICPDCLIAVANGDFSGISEADERRIKFRMAEHARLGFYVIPDADVQEEFMWRTCEMCGALPGPRYKAQLRRRL